MGTMESELSRVGVRFERVAPATQAMLDRFVYPLMQRKARARPNLIGAERRVAARVELEPAEGVRLTLLPPRQLGAIAKAQGATDDPGTTCVVRDLSTTGCAFLCPKGKLTVGLLVAARLEGRGVSIDLQVKVTNVSELPATSG